MSSNPLGSDPALYIASAEGPITFGIDTSHRLFGATTTPVSVTVKLVTDDASRTNVPLTDAPVVVNSIVSQTIQHGVVSADTDYLLLTVFDDGKGNFQTIETSLKCLD